MAAQTGTVEVTVSYKITLTGQADSPTKITLNEAVVEPGDTGATITYGYNTLNEAPDNWQTGREFSGLAANTTYYFFAKAEDSSNYAKTISQGVAITTPEKAVSRIEITAQPANLSYTSGQTLDLSDLSVHGDAEVPLGLPGFAAAGALVQGHIVGRRELRVELGL